VMLTMNTMSPDASPSHRCSLPTSFLKVMTVGFNGYS
jgi:hypothetical protein